MGAGVSSCAAATGVLDPMRYSTKPTGSLESALPYEVGVDPEFTRRARQLAVEDACCDLTWCWDDELTRHEGISLRTSHYVKARRADGGKGREGEMGRPTHIRTPHTPCTRRVYRAA